MEMENKKKKLKEELSKIDWVDVIVRFTLYFTMIAGMVAKAVWDIYANSEDKVTVAKIVLPLVVSPITFGSVWEGVEQYGCKKEWFADEQPQQEVYLDSYYIDKYPVTNQQYKEFIDATGHDAKNWKEGKYPENRDDHPVVNVSWEDACKYAKWAGKRLPTEAEWEKAARGTENRLWPWGNEFDESRCNYDSLETSPVTQYPNGANPYGVMDMVGNVWEWVADWYDKNYYNICPGKNPKGPDDGTWRVVCGGARLRYVDTYARCTARNRYAPLFKDCTVGFRCAKNIS